MIRRGVVWGKWEPTRAAYPLLAHLLDTAAFATLMWDEWMSVPMKDLLVTAGFGGSESLGFVAGVHDCGKADPWFVGQLGSSRAKEFENNLHLLGAAGLPNVQDPAWLAKQVAARGSITRRMMRHESMSGHAVQREGLPVWVSAVVSGHHGRYQPDAEARTRQFVGRHRSWIDASAWSVQQSDLVAQVAHALDLEMDSALPESVDGSLIPLLTGLVCLADWCASDENFLADAPLHLLDQEPSAYLQARVVQARDSLSSTLGLPVRPTGSFEELFDGFTPDRAVQRWAVEAGDHGPGLTIIAVPMGEGKTETALWMHSTSTAGDGLVFALPTMATADAMFDRVQRFYSGTPALAALSHGSAMLNAFYAASVASPTGICDGDDRVGLSGSEWLRGRHRSVTAPVTVSTCDQVLAAAVDHKFLPVRLASLADKHVVLDEVHTYDPYQDALLRRLLGWLGAYRIRVTLLSATLPTRRANDYLRAYATGAGAGPVEPANGCYPAVSRLTPGHSAPAIVPVEAHRRYRHQVSCVPVVVGADSYSGYVLGFAEETARYVGSCAPMGPQTGSG